MPHQPPQVCVATPSQVQGRERAGVKPDARRRWTGRARNVRLGEPGGQKLAVLGRGGRGGESRHQGPLGTELRPVALPSTAGAWARGTRSSRELPGAGVQE